MVRCKKKKEILTSTLDVSPSGDPRGRPGGEDAAVRRQTHRPDVVCEVDRRGQPQQGDVVVDRGVLVVRMSDDLGRRAGNLVRVQRLLGVTTEINRETKCLVFSSTGGRSGRQDVSLKQKYLE